MKERPILFSAPMVRALLAGTKSQTRRGVKGADAWHPDTREARIIGIGNLGVAAMPYDEFGRILGDAIRCPYGAPGDRLWVRESFAFVAEDKFGPVPDSIIYRADDNEGWGGRWRPSIFMPRCASRITLEVTEVRVERLQSISHDDAIAEGLQWDKHIGWGTWDADGSPRCGGDHDPVDAYRCLWTNINGNGSWELNPWVWVVVFRRVQQ